MLWLNEHTKIKIIDTLPLHIWPQILQVKLHLKLNNNKTEFLVITSPYNKCWLPDICLRIGEESIRPSTSVRNLGIIFDDVMSMSPQVISLTKNITFHLRNITRIRRFLDYETCNHIVRSLVLSRLDYGNVLLLELAQNTL